MTPTNASGWLQRRLCVRVQSNYGILGTVISALSRSPGPSPCSRSNSLIVDHPSPSQHAKLSPTSSLTVDVSRGHLPPPCAGAGAVRSNSFLSVDYANHHLHRAPPGQRVHLGLHVDTASLMTSPPNGLTSSEDESHLPPRRCRSVDVSLRHHAD